MRWLVGKLVDEGWRAPPDLARLTLADPLPPLDAEIEDPAEVAADDVPVPEAAAAPALNELIAAVEVFRTVLTERLDNLDAHLDRVDANIRQEVAGVVTAVRALQTQVEELTAANANAVAAPLAVDDGSVGEV
ncbi:hypothetical protein B0H65DRAFT_471349 [Neurospora tetraspora]|uniref:Uncharacterized protein n=1 Tax=Neurospora tetraspora TaxID=94610 RepID=A0AAE0MP29_9PEZI|nr:hypothetical protein B0H65DRAFT_471349 [Neurospora tetraspora]